MLTLLLTLLLSLLLVDRCHYFQNLNEVELKTPLDDELLASSDES